MIARRTRAVLISSVIALVVASCGSARSAGHDALTSYPALLVLAPHPDDETLGFAGLIEAYLRAGKPVAVVVVTDGDAYCEACRFWKTGSVNGAMCTAADLANFGAVRRSESEAAMSILGAPAPRFLDYPDTGLAAAWRNDPPRRSDFSSCASCASCGYGDGPQTALTAATLQASLRALIAAEPDRALIATTHWLDGHPDHAALGNFVRQLHGAHPVAYAVIHARTKNTANADCWYPAPGAPQCPCMDDEAKALRDPGWVARNAGERFRPSMASALPNDAAYGEAARLPLSESDVAVKLRAVRAYASQSGRLGAHPAALDGIIDCSGYLSSFVRHTETFILQP